jgi:tetratricopeptide (TPR) repeat protein
MNLFVPDVSHLPEVKQICKQVPLYQGGNEILLIFNTPVKIDLMWAKNVYVKTGLKIGPDFSSSGLSVKETVIDWRMVEKLQGIAIQLYDEQRLGEAYKKFRKLYHLTADVGKKRFAKKKMNEILQTFERQKHEMQRLLNSVLISLNPRLIDLLEEKKKQYCKKFKGLEGVELISKRCEEVEGILRRLDLSKAEQRAKALLNLGRIFYGQKKFVMAEDILKSIVKNYPQTEAFSEALDLLQKIKEQ